MSDNLGDFFNLIGSEKKRQGNKKKNLVGETSLGDLFAELQEEKKRIQSLKEEEEKKKKELIGNVSLDDLFSSLAEEKKKTKSANEQKKKEQEKLKKEAKVFETFLFSEPKPKSVDTTDWKDDYVPGDVESINIIEPEPLQPSPGAEKFEEIVKEEKEEKVEISETIEKSMEILDKLIPEEEKVEDGPDEEIRRLKREMDQLRKMVYETVRTAAAQGGGGEVRLEFLDDVDRDTAKVDGKVLQYNSTTGKWEGVTSGVGTTRFVDLVDVDSSVSAVDQRSIVYDQPSGKFIGTDILGSLRQLISESVNDGDVIVYSSAEGRFIATSQGNLTGAGRTTLATLDDVDVTGISTNDVLIFNGTDFEFTTPFEIVDRSDSVDDDTLDYGSF
jgi:septum formation inhibitor MinC